MASLRKRLDNVIAELAIIREALNGSSRYPPCCLIFHKNGKISCDMKGPLPKEQFLKECESCRAEIKSFLDQFRSKGTATVSFRRKTSPQNEKGLDAWSKEIGLEMKVWAIKNVFKRGIKLRKWTGKTHIPSVIRKKRA